MSHPQTLGTVMCPDCGEAMPRRMSPTAVCTKCAEQNWCSPPIGWPSNNGGDVDEPAGCPHCIQTPRATCCVCKETRWITRGTLVTVMASVWAREGCHCGACKHLGRPPSGEEDVTKMPTPKRSNYVGYNKTSDLPFAPKPGQTHFERKATLDGSTRAHERRRDLRLQDRDRIVEVVQRAATVEAACEELGMTREGLVAKLNNVGITLGELRA